YDTPSRRRCRQRSVSARVHAASVPDPTTALIHRLIGDHPDAPPDVLSLAPDSTSTPLLVAAAILADDLDLLTPAAEHAPTTPDPPLVPPAHGPPRAHA